MRTATASESDPSFLPLSPVYSPFRSPSPSRSLSPSPLQQQEWMPVGPCSSVSLGDGWCEYVSAERDSVMLQNPLLTQRELTHLLEKKWRALPESIRQSYRQLARGRKQKKNHKNGQTELLDPASGIGETGLNGSTATSTRRPNSILISTSTSAAESTSTASSTSRICLIVSHRYENGVEYWCEERFGPNRRREWRHMSDLQSEPCWNAALMQYNNKIRAKETEKRRKAKRIKEGQEEKRLREVQQKAKAVEEKARSSNHATTRTTSDYKTKPTHIDLDPDQQRRRNENQTQNQNQNDNENENEIEPGSGCLIIDDVPHPDPGAFDRNPKNPNVRSESGSGSDSVLSSSSSSISVPAGYWRCAQCTVFNPNFTQNCEVCEVHWSWKPPNSSLSSDTQIESNAAWGSG